MIPRGLIGVVHLPALPGDPGHGGGGFAAVRQFALADAAALTEGGAAALLLENFGSTPFPKGTTADPVAPHHVAALALLAAEVKALHGLPVGVNCLRNDAVAALGVAAAAGADFVRVNVHVGAYVTDQGVIEGEAARSLRFRAALQPDGPRVSIAADVLVKHARPLAPLTPAEATHDCVHRGRADAIIVTGDATGAPISVEQLTEVAAAAGDTPVLLGSGLTPENAPELAPHAQGGIVGTWVKKDGQIQNPVDPNRVATLVKITSNRWKT